MMASREKRDTDTKTRQPAPGAYSAWTLYETVLFQKIGCLNAVTEVYVPPDTTVNAGQGRLDLRPVGPQ